MLFSLYWKAWAQLHEVYMERVRLSVLLARLLSSAWSPDKSSCTRTHWRQTRPWKCDLWGCTQSIFWRRGGGGQCSSLLWVAASEGAAVNGEGYWGETWRVSCLLHTWGGMGGSCEGCGLCSERPQLLGLAVLSLPCLLSPMSWSKLHVLYCSETEAAFCLKRGFFFSFISIICYQIAWVLSC